MNKKQAERLVLKSAAARGIKSVKFTGGNLQMARVNVVIALLTKLAADPQLGLKRNKLGYLVGDIKKIVQGMRSPYGASHLMDAAQEIQNVYYDLAENRMGNIKNGLQAALHYLALARSEVQGQ